MRMFEEALMKKFNISKENREKVASEQRRENIEIFKELMNESIENIKLAQVTGGNEKMKEVIETILSREKTASETPKRYAIDMKKYASSILQRMDIANEANKRRVYSDDSTKLIKVAYSSMWDEDVINLVSPLKLATQMLINDMSFFRGRDDLNYDFIVELPETEKSASENSMKESILNERVLERIENEIDEEVADDLRSDYDTMYNALPDPYKEQINGIVEDEMGKVASANSLKNKYLSQTERGVADFLASGKEPKFPTAKDVTKSVTPGLKLKGVAKTAGEVKKMEKKDTSPYIQESAESLSGGEFPNKGVEFTFTREDLKKMFPEQTVGGPFRGVEYDKEKSSLHTINSDGEAEEKPGKTVYDMLKEKELDKKKTAGLRSLNQRTIDRMDHTDSAAAERALWGAGLGTGAAAYLKAKDNTGIPRSEMSGVGRALDSAGDLTAGALDLLGTGAGGAAGAIYGYNAAKQLENPNKYKTLAATTAGALGGGALTNLVGEGLRRGFEKVSEEMTLDSLEKE